MLAQVMTYTEATKTSIPEAWVQVLVEIPVFYINKSCFQLEDALARSPNLG